MITVYVCTSVLRNMSFNLDETWNINCQRCQDINVYVAFGNHFYNTQIKRIMSTSQLFRWH